MPNGICSWPGLARRKPVRQGKADGMVQRIRLQLLMGSSERRQACAQPGRRSGAAFKPTMAQGVPIQGAGA